MHNGISIAHDGGWMLGKLRKGYTVLDIGITTLHRGWGWYYGKQEIFGNCQLIIIYRRDLMDFKKEFKELASKYNLTYQHQDFKNCFGGYWWVYTHSLYNDSGCFTIHCLPQRGEVDCYFTEKFSTDRKELCGQIINVFEVEKDIWNKNERIWIF